MVAMAAASAWSSPSSGTSARRRPGVRRRSWPTLYRRPPAGLALSVLFPFGAHWRTDRGHSTIVLNTYVHKGTGEYAGAWSVHFWPLFNFGRPRLQDRVERALRLVGYSREGIHRTLRLLWGHRRPAGTRRHAVGLVRRDAAHGQ